MLDTQKTALKTKKVKMPTLEEFILLIIVFLIVVPDGLSNISYSAYRLFYVYGFYAALLIVCILFLAENIAHLQFPKCLFTSFLFLLGTMLVTVIHGSGFGNWINCFSVFLAVLLLVAWQRTRLDRLMLIFLFVLEFWIYVNLILMIIFPDGMYYLESNNSYNNWILGYKSSLQYYIFPALCFSWINKEYRGQKVRFYVLLIASFFETITSGNTMLTVGILFFFLSVFLGLINVKKVYNVRNYLIGVLAANAVFIFYLTWFISTDIGGMFFSITGKNMTLSSRASVIWPITIQYIRENLFWGNGLFSSQERVEMYNGLKAAIHSHNQILEILFIGGVFLLVLYIVMHISIGKRLAENRSLTTAKILALAVFVLYIMMIVEVFTRRVAAGIWLLLFLACMNKELHEQLMERTDCKYSVSKENKRKWRIHF